MSPTWNKTGLIQREVEFGTGPQNCGEDSCTLQIHSLSYFLVERTEERLFQNIISIWHNAEFPHCAGNVQE